MTARKKGLDKIRIIISRTLSQSSPWQRSILKTFESKELRPLQSQEVTTTSCSAPWQTAIVRVRMEHCPVETLSLVEPSRIGTHR